MTGRQGQAGRGPVRIRRLRQARPGTVTARLSEWVRLNSQKYLLEAAQEPLARRYLGRPGPVSRPGLQVFFWKRIFVPLYRLLPWEWRQAIILAMPGSHRRGWPPDSDVPSTTRQERTAA
jgi:hypothetical protein